MRELGNVHVTVNKNEILLYADMKIIDNHLKVESLAFIISTMHAWRTTTLGNYILGYILYLQQLGKRNRQVSVTE